jgi:transposase InsO family protein
MKLIDKQHTQDPVRFGQMKFVEELTNTLGIPINRKRVQRLMRLMGIEGEYQKPRTTISAKNHKIYPYLLRDYAVLKPNEVWSTDITYIPMRHGYMYLTAIIDWYSRYVISWELKALDSDSSRIIIEQTFYEFLDFCDKHSIEYRILSLASKNRLELIKGINPKRILGLEYSKANSKTYTSILKSFSKNKIEWFQLDDSPLALRSGRRAGLKTIMMLNDVFTIKDYQLNKEFIDFKTVSFNHIKKLIS